MSTALFEIRGVASPVSSPTLLGMWNVVPPAVFSGASFDVGASDTPEATVWRANLDAQDADANLDRAQQQLQLAQGAVRQAQARLDEFIQQQSSGAAFAAGEETRAPELELSSLLNDLANQQAGAAFGVLDVLGVDLTGLLGRFQEFLDQLRDLLGDPLLVETNVADMLVARTAVGWAGHTHTAFAVNLENPGSARHVQTLGLALGSREILFQVAVLAVEGAARLALIVAMPANALVMIPGIYKFIMQVMEEYSKIRERMEIRV